EAILAALDNLATKAGPDDRVIIFLAGHGGLRAGGRQGVGRWVFCCPQYDEDNPTGTGIPNEVLQEKLAAIPCRKLLLLDACHSGDVADSNPVRSLTPLGQGPVILAAADRMQVSLEDPGFGRQLRWCSSKRTGQGLFTYAVLIAMTGNLRKTDLD